MSTIARMDDIIYRQGEWANPPLWPPAYRKWRAKATAELKRLYDLRCAEVSAERAAERDAAYRTNMYVGAPGQVNPSRESVHAYVINVVLQRELNCGPTEAQRLAWVIAEAIVEAGG